MEKAKQYEAQRKQLVKGQQEEERKKRTHRLIQIGAAVESVLGSTIVEEDIPKLIAFLKKQEANGKELAVLAIFHMSIKIVGRSKGKSIIAASAYLSGFLYCTYFYQSTSK